MTDEETALTKRDEALPLYMGSAKGVLALADRLTKTHKAIKQHAMTAEEVLHMAQYFIVNDANPWRDDIYVWRDKRGDMAYTDSYRILSRWARADAPFDHTFEKLRKKDGERHRIRCKIMRDDRKEAMREYIALGFPPREAFDLVAVYADGVVREDETGKAPPKGWSWEQRARTRAFKNALRVSHGTPSPRELHAAAMLINGVETIQDDWIHEGPELSGEEAEALAVLNARERERAEEWDKLSTEERQEKFENNVDLLRGDHDEGDPLGLDARFAKERAVAHEEEVKLTHEQVAAALEKKKEEEAETCQERVVKAEVVRKSAKITTPDWAPAAVRLVKEVGFYLTADGSVNMQQMAGVTREVLKHEVITDDNLTAVIGELRLYAEENLALENGEIVLPATASGSITCPPDPQARLPLEG